MKHTFLPEGDYYLWDSLKHAKLSWNFYILSLQNMLLYYLWNMHLCPEGYYDSWNFA